ncbi:DUF3108 domain-containing protein [Ralstonia sp. L16]
MDRAKSSGDVAARARADHPRAVAAPRAGAAATAPGCAPAPPRSEPSAPPGSTRSGADTHAVRARSGKHGPIRVHQRWRSSLGRYRRGHRSQRRRPGRATRTARGRLLAAALGYAAVRHLRQRRAQRRWCDPLGHRWKNLHACRGNSVATLLWQTRVSQRGHRGPVWPDPARYEEVRGRRQPDLTTFHYAADPTPASGAQGEPTVTFTRTPAVLPLPEGTQDRFSVFLQLTGLARGGPERIASPGLTLEFPIADTDSVEVARVQHVGEDTIDTPNGTIRAQHFIRLPRRAQDKRRVEIWLSADHGWLPVRLRQTEPNGMQFDLVYQSQEGG